MDASSGSKGSRQSAMRPGTASSAGKLAEGGATAMVSSLGLMLKGGNAGLKRALDLQVGLTLSSKLRSA